MIFSCRTSSLISEIHQIMLAGKLKKRTPRLKLMNLCLPVGMNETILNTVLRNQLSSEPKVEIIVLKLTSLTLVCQMTSTNILQDRCSMQTNQRVQTSTEQTCSTFKRTTTLHITVSNS